MFKSFTSNAYKIIASKILKSILLVPCVVSWVDVGAAGLGRCGGGQVGLGQCEGGWVGAM